MKRSLLLGAVSAIAMIASAQAADLGGGMKDTEVAPPIYNWAGFYVGANGGYAWNQGGVSALADEWCDECFYGARARHETDGGFGGGQIGFNWQRDRLVYGIEGDVEGAGVTGSVSAFPDSVGYGWAHSSDQLDWFATIRGRVGLIPYDNWLVYITGGVAFGGIQDNLTQYYDFGKYSISSSHNDTFVGYVLGAGVEYGFTPAWSVKLEYQFMDLGSTRLMQSAYDPCHCTYVSSELESNHSFSTVRIGINYHFIPEYVPLK